MPDAINPAAADGYQIAERSVHELARDAQFDSIGDWIGHRVDRVKSHWNSMQQFRQSLGYWYGRRHTIFYRNPTKPWVGSSNIVMPLIDKTGIGIIASYGNIAFSSDRTAAVHADDGASQRTRASFEMYLNSIFGGRSRIYSMRRYRKQVQRVNASITHQGRGIWHTDYSRLKRPGIVQLDAQSLPGLFGDLVVVPDLTDNERALQISNEQQGGSGIVNLNPPPIVQHFGRPVNPLNRGAYSANIEKIRELCERAFDLDPKVPEDKAARDKILKWHREGAAEPLYVPMMELIEDTPIARHVHVTDLIVPPGTDDIEDANELTIRMRMSEEQFTLMAKARKWNEEVVDEVLKHPPRDPVFGTEDRFELRHLESGRRGSSRLRISTEMRTGLSQDERIEIWLDFRTLDVGGIDGMPKHMPIRTMSYIVPGTKRALSTQRLPYRHGEWPVTVIPFEEEEDSYFASRCLGEIINDADLHVTAAERAKLNTMLLNSGKQFFIRRNSYLDGRMRFAPVALWPTENPAQDAREVQPNNSSMLWEREYQTQQVWVQGHVGDQATDLTADSKLREPRTATEVGTREDKRRSVMGVRGVTYLTGMDRMVQQIGANAQQFAPEEFMVHASGGSPVAMKKQEIMGAFTVTMAAAAGSFDPDHLANRALERMQVLLQVSNDPRVASDPQFIPDLARALKDFLDAHDPGASRRLLPERPPREVIMALAQQVTQAQQAIAEAEALQQQVGPAEPGQPEVQAAAEQAAVAGNRANNALETTGARIA